MLGDGFLDLYTGVEMNRFKMVLAGVFVACGLVATTSASAQCARCDLVFGCQHGPLQNPQATDCHMRPDGNCTLLPPFPCGGGGGETEEVEIIANVVGDASGWAVTFGDFDNGRRLSTTCRGVVVGVEYTEEQEVRSMQELRTIVL
jgi:hypothetical protein